MSVNSNGDYEALANLLYPSIEASGNVYYGQTRKLTMDEVFDKYKGGFESHIESRRVEDASSEYGFKYEKYFCWNLGPLSGEFCIDGDGEHHIPMESYPLYYAKYLLNKTIVAEENVLNSGTYNSYHYDVEPKLKKVFYHGGKNPCDDNPWDGKSFYVVKDSDDYYLYVAIINSVSDDANLLPEEYDPNNPLCFTLLSGGSGYLHLDMHTGSGYQGEVITYSYVSRDSEGVLVSGSPNMVAYLDSSCTQHGNWSKVHLDDTNKPEQHESFYTYFSFISDGGVNHSATITGDIRSLQLNKDAVGVCEFLNLFAEDTVSNNLRIIDAPKLPSYILSESCYHGMFLSCINLKRAPMLPASTLPCDCYGAMFKGCSQLITAPLLIGTEFESVEQSGLTLFRQYKSMFEDCASLKEVCCISGPVGDSHKDWLKNSGVKTIHTSKDSVWNASDTSVVPSGCTIVRDFELEYTYDD